MALSKADRFKILQRDGFSCQYCGRKGPEVTLEIDHVIPQSKGGTDDESNLVTACKECNLGKSNKPLVLNKMEDHNDPLVGLWFHRFMDDQLKNAWQGVVEAKISDGFYLCQMFEWVSGGPSDLIVANIEEMPVRWRFYCDYEDWLHEGKRIRAYCEKDALT